MRRFIILCITLAYGVLCLHSQTSIKDSLLRIYLNSPHDSTRLDVLHNIARLDQQTPTFLYYENKLLQEATEQNNLRYQSLSTYEHITYYYNRLDQKRLKQWMNRMEQLSQKHNYYKDYFKAKKLLIESYAITQQIELAIHESNEMYSKAEKLKDRNGMREACLCLMTNYLTTLRYTEGIDALNKAFTFLSPQDSPMDKVNMHTKAVLAYSLMNDDENLFKSLNRLEEAQKELITASPLLKNSYGTFFLFLETQYAFYYIRENQPQEAWAHLQKAEQHLDSNIFQPYQAALFNAYSEYYRLIKNYNEALQKVDTTIQLMNNVSFGDVIRLSATKADILIEMGYLAEALPIYNQVIYAKDSLYNSLSASQMEEIQSLYNMDKLILEREQHETQLHQIYLTIVILVLVVLIAFVIRMYLARRKLQKNEKEALLLSHIAEEANEVKSRFLANMSYNIRIPLNNVVGFSQLLSTDAGLSDTERQEYATIIQANSTELIQLVNDVLDLSRLEAKMMKFKIQECEINEMYNDFAGMAQMNSEGHIHVTLETNIEYQTFLMDASRLNQAVLSMLIYPEPNDTDREVTLQIMKDEKNGLFVLHISNSPLADPKFASQTVSVRHKINQLLFEHFGGSYQVGEDMSIRFSVAY